MRNKCLLSKTQPVVFVTAAELIQSLILMTSFSLNYLFPGPTSNAVTLGVRTSTIWQMYIQSTTITVSTQCLHSSCVRKEVLSCLSEGMCSPQTCTCPDCPPLPTHLAQPILDHFMWGVPASMANDTNKLPSHRGGPLPPPSKRWLYYKEKFSPHS